jgi:hypothetical protein
MKIDTKYYRVLRILSVSLLITVVFSSLQAAFAYKMLYTSYIETEEYEITFIGESAGEQFGASVAGGDINGDGYDDIVVGSPFYSSKGINWNGKVSVYFGSSDLEKRLYDTQEDTPDFVVYGRHDGDQLGIDVDSGDFNNDGYDDLAIGSYNALAENGRPGKVFMFFGQSKFSDRRITLSSERADLEFIGEADGDGFGVSVEVGDINHDDIDDLLIGAPFSMSINDVKTGNVYGYYGWTFGIDSDYRYDKFYGNKDANVIFVGREKDQRFGGDIEVGNVVGGHYNDVLISAYFSDGPSGPQAGKVYIYKGPKTYSRYEKRPYDVLVGEKAFDWFGFSLSLGQFDSNHKDDLLVSAFPYLNRGWGGKAYMLSGRNEFVAGDDPDDDLLVVGEDSADIYFGGEQSENLLGSSVLFADVDGDEKDDILLGAPGISTLSSSEPGEVYVYHNKFYADQQSFDIENGETNSYIYGVKPDDWFGAKMAKFDFNGDGYDDVAVSARYADRYDARGLVGDSNNGKVYLLLGHSVPFGDSKLIKEPGDDYVTRGEFIDQVVGEFSLKDRRKDFINNCYDYREFCFFAFSGQSNFSGLRLEPNIILYPDVPYGSDYYEPITVATMLGLLSGYTNEDGTPFKPEAPITRMQALKVILGANQLVAPLHRFELIEILGSEESLRAQESYYDDVDPAVSKMWWYPRFANYAYDHGIIENKSYFRPDDYITIGELENVIQNTIEFLGLESEAV